MKNLKKSVFVAVILVCTSLSVSAQIASSFGIKGGLNYSANGDYFESVNQNAQNPERNIGYHVGIYGKFGNTLYLRPELIYTATKSDYDADEFSVKKIDLPVLFGLKVLGPLSIFAGPSFQYILETEFDGINIDDVENDFSVGLNFGIGVNFNKIGIDLRYERGFTENEGTFINNNIGGVESRIDTRPDQLILSLSVSF